MIRRTNPSGTQLIIFFIGIVGIIILIGINYFDSQREKIRKKKYEELSAIATLKASQIINYRHQRLRDANTIIKSRYFSNAVQNWLENPDALELKASIIHDLQLKLERHHFMSVSLLDIRGKVILIAESSSYSPGMKCRSCLTSPITLNSTTFGDIYCCEKCPEFHLDILIPMLIDGKNIGGAIFRIDPEQFLNPLIQNWPTPSKTSESLLVSKDNDEVVFINQLRHQNNTYLKLRFKIDSSNIHIPAVAATYGIEGLVEGIDYRGVPVLSDARKIPDSPWWMIVKVDLDEIYSDTRDVALFIGLFIGLLILLFASVFFWLWTNQKKSMDLLAAQTKFELQAREITEQKRDEEALRLKNWVFDASMAANSIWDKSGIITEANESFLRLWNYSNKKDLIGKPLNKFMQNRGGAARIISILNKKGKWEGYYIAKKKDGTTFNAHGMASVLHDNHGVVIGYQSIVVDITERMLVDDKIRQLNKELEIHVKERTKELEERSTELSENQAALLNIVEDLNEKSQQLTLSKSQLEATNKELESFSYSVSHDLRAPLRALDGFAKILLEEYSPELDSEGKRYLNIITENAMNMGQLIDDLLAFSRLNRTDMQLVEINMLNLVESVFKELTLQADNTNIEFKIAHISNAYGDYAMVKQVWRNLIGNAIKYGPESKKLSIEINNSTEGEENIYSIKDNGVGFDMVYKDKLFGVFQRLHSKKEFEGTGVGLAIVQRIIHRLGGRVWAESQVSKGATFYFTLHNNVN